VELYVQTEVISYNRISVRVYTVSFEIHNYYYYYLLQLRFHSVIVVHTLVTNKNKYTEKRQYKNAVNTSTHITKTSTQLSEHPHITIHTHTHIHTLQNPYIHTPTLYKTHTYTHSHITKQVKTTTVQDTHQIKEASKPAGNWFQLLMALFTKEYLTTSVLCFLVLIFRL
jgi:hypothetical protein